MAQQQFKLRMPEPLRAALEESRRRSGSSLNTEIVQRLDRGLHQEAVLGSPEMARQAFLMAASFANATHTKDWTTDPIAYADGVASVLDALLRDIPAGPEKRLAVEAIVMRLMTRLAQEKEQAK
jgi:Arc-like DNA binding domain